MSETTMDSLLEELKEAVLCVEDDPDNSVSIPMDNILYMRRQMNTILFAVKTINKPLSFSFATNQIAKDRYTFYFKVLNAHFTTKTY